MSPKQWRWPRRQKGASEWFVQLHGGARESVLSDEFIRWLEETPQHALSYEDREVVWALTLELRRRPGIETILREAENAIAARRAIDEPRQGARRQPWRRLALPAAALLMSVAAVVIAGVLLTRPITADYSTGKGEQRQQTLPDGSSMFLNTATHVRIRFSRARRSVDLDIGEALFSVAKDPRRPFEVVALGGVTVATGTQFVVRLKQAHAEVSVLDGTVRVAPPTTRDDEAQSVTAGQALDYSATGQLSALRPVNRERIEAWKMHRILFNDTPLSDAIAEYNQYGGVPVVLKESQLADRRVHGVFRIGDEPSFIHALVQGLPLKAVQNGAEIELIDR